MPAVTVRIPGLLARFADGDSAVALDAETVEGAVCELLARYPALEPHLFDQRGSLRPHLRLLVDGRVLGGEDRAALALDPGADVVFVQAVSGG